VDTLSLLQAKDLPKIPRLAMAWIGCSYDLALELGRADDRRVAQAIDAVWSFPDLESASSVRPRNPVELRARVSGVARVPGASQRIACSTSPALDGRGAEWLTLSLSTYAIEQAFPIRGLNGDRALREPLDAWLRRVAAHVHARVGVKLATSGWSEVPFVDAQTIADRGVPSKREVGYLVPSDGGLSWFAPTELCSFDLSA
jgi:hypothetical protein